MNAIYSNIDELISESNNNYKLINDIPTKFRFWSNRNIIGNKSKPIPMT